VPVGVRIVFRGEIFDRNAATALLLSAATILPQMGPAPLGAMRAKRHTHPRSVDFIHANVAKAQCVHAARSSPRIFQRAGAGSANALRRVHTASGMVFDAVWPNDSRPANGKYLL
jgi:hypothetical protein